VASVTLRLLLAFVLACLLNVKIFGQAAFRTVFFLPSILSGVAVAIMFIWVFHPNSGLLNRGLALFGVRGPNWLIEPEWAMPALVIQSLWSGVGGPMVIYLAGLQGIPQSLYEAAEVDGANWWARVRHVTIPLMSPVIFLTAVMGVIGSFQVFTSSYVMTRGGPNYATLTVVLYLYRKGFEYFSFGYAAALAWVLFFIIIGFTYLQFRWGRRWVYYEAPNEGRR
jgi:multiple sugar transport system permease protein